MSKLRPALFGAVLLAVPLGVATAAPAGAVPDHRVVVVDTKGNVCSDTGSGPITVVPVGSCLK